MGQSTADAADQARQGALFGAPAGAAGFGQMPATAGATSQSGFAQPGQQDRPPTGSAADNATRPAAAGEGGAQAASALNTFFGFAPKADATDGPAGSGSANASGSAAGSGPAAGEGGAQRRSFADFAAPPANGAQGSTADNADGSPASKPVLGSLFTAAPTRDGAQAPAAGAQGSAGTADGAAPIATDAKSFFFGAKKGANKQVDTTENSSAQPAQAGNQEDAPTTTSETGSATAEPPAKKGFFAATETKSIDDEVDENLVQKAQETKGFFGVTQSKTTEEAVSENNETKAQENKGFFGVTVKKSKEDTAAANALKRNSKKKGFFSGTTASKD